MSEEIEKKDKLQYIILWGDAIDGHEFIGPFDDQDEAVKYCEEDAEISDGGWGVVLLQKPATEQPMYDLNTMEKE